MTTGNDEILRPPSHPDALTAEEAAAQRGMSMRDFWAARAGGFIVPVVEVSHRLWFAPLDDDEEGS